MSDFMVSVSSTPSLRFAIAGGLVTLISAAAYWLISLVLDPLVASISSHGAGVLVGFRIHAHWSFAGIRNQPVGLSENMRFLLASAIPLSCNALWVLVLVKHLGLSSWAPVLPMMLITPALTYLVNKLWVFGNTAEQQSG